MPARLTKILLALATLSSACTFSAAQAAVIGTFDSSRSAGSFVTAQFDDARSELTTALPGTTFTSFSELTATNLAGVDVLHMGYGSSALSAAEQTELLNFISAGGTVFAQVGINDNAPPVLGLFDMEQSSSTTYTGGSYTVASSTDPVIDGPFGVVSQYAARDQRAFRPKSGQSFTAIGIIELTNTGVADNALLALLPRGTAFGDGQMLFYTNGSMWRDDDYFYNNSGNKTLLLNLVASAHGWTATVPEPGTAWLGLLFLAAFHRQRR